MTYHTIFPAEELEANIAENKRSAEMLELQETLCWPSLLELDPTAYIPEVSLLSSSYWMGRADSYLDLL